MERLTPRRVVRVEILGLEDCPYLEPTLALVERAIAETGVSARIELVLVTNEPQAHLKRFLGSPTVRVDGLDVEPGAGDIEDFGVGGRLYRTDRGISGWPDEEWVRDALVRRSAIALVPAYAAEA
jgi:hypothetical protein